jgi:hypothetical protein
LGNKHSFAQSLAWPLTLPEPVAKQTALIKELEGTIAKLEASEASQAQAVAKETAALEKLRETLKEAQVLH